MKHLAELDSFDDRSLCKKSTKVVVVEGENVGHLLEGRLSGSGFFARIFFLKEDVPLLLEGTRIAS